MTHARPTQREIDDVRAQLATPESQDALRTLEARHRASSDLAGLFELYREAARGLDARAAVRALAVRVIDVLKDALPNEPTETTRGTLRRRQAELVSHAGDPLTAATEFAVAFREFPDEAALDRLAGLAGLDDASDLGFAALKLRFDLSDDPAVRAAVGARLGPVALERAQLGLAELAFRAVLAERPADADATDALASLEASRESRRRMLEDLRAEAETAPEPAARSRAWQALAEAILDGASTPAEHQDAQAAQRSAFEADPCTGDAASRLLERAVKARAWPEVQRIVETWTAAAAVRGGREHADVLCLAGLALLEVPDQAAAALEKLQAANTLRPGDARIVHALDRALTQLGRHQDVIRIYEEARKATKSREDERAWLGRQAEILWKRLGDVDEAEKLYRRIRAADPRDLGVLDFYEDYLTKKEDWMRLHAVLGQKLGLVPPDKRVDVAVQMAELAESKLHNLDKAIEAYKRVLGEDPDNPRAADQLVALLKKTHKWHALIEFLNGQVRRLPETDTEKRTALLFQIIDVYQDPDKLPVEEMVIHTYNRIVQISPTNVQALDSLTQRYEEAKRWSELVPVLQKKIEATSDEGELLELFHQVADLYISKMSNEAQAVPFLERILELDPQNLDIVRKLRSIYKAKHNLERLYATYEAELKLLKGHDRVAVLTELAVLATDKLYWPDHAIRHWEELLEQNPREERAVTALVALYPQVEAWGRMVTLLESRMEHAKTSKKKLELLEKLAQIQHEKQEALGAAEKVYRQILELSPAHLAARKALQRLLIAGERWDDLKALYAEHQDWRGYVQFLDEAAVREADTRLRFAIYLEVVRVLEEKLNDPRGAVDRLEKLLFGAPTDVTLAAMLDARYAKLALPDKRIAVLDILAAQAPDETAALAALRTGADLLESLGRHREALAWLCRVAAVEFARAPTDGPGRARLCDGLEAAAEHADAWDDLLGFYRKVVAELHDLAPRRDLLRRYADLLKNRLRRSKEAIAAYEQLADLDERDLETLTALEQLTYASQDWEAFERVLERQVQALSRSKTKADLAQRRQVLLRLGELYADILVDADQAVACYRRILESHPDDPEAVAGLDGIFTSEGRWEPLIALLDEQLARAKDTGKRVALSVRIAEVLHQKLEDPDGALRRLEDALALDPTDASGARLLDALFDDGVARDRVGALLEPILKKDGRFERLVEILTDRLSRTDDAAARRALLTQGAQLREEKLGDAEGAFAWTCECVALLPQDPATRADLERLAATTGRWAEVADLYAAILTIPDAQAPFGLVPAPGQDTALEQALLVRLAQIDEAQLERFDRSVACYERALALDPESLDIVSALERLHARREDWESLLAVYRRKVELTWDVAQKKQVYGDICRLLRDELDRPEDAIDYYRSILALDEQDAEVIEELESLYARFERWDELVELLRRRLATATERSARAATLYELAVLYRDRLGDPAQAIDTLAAILIEEPDHLDSVAALEAMLYREEAAGYEELAPRAADVLEPWLRERGEWEREIGVLRVRAKLAGDDRTRARFLETAAARYDQAGTHAREAFACYADAFRLDPSRDRVREALRRLAAALNGDADLATVLESAVRDEDPALSVALLLEVASIARDRLGDAARATRTYERILSLDPVSSAALEALDALYSQTDRTAERVAVLERRAEIAPDERARRTILYEVGLLQIELEHADEAIEALSYVVEHGDPAREPLVMDAVDRLTAVYEITERWLPLVELLALKAEVVTSIDEKKTHLLLAANVQETQLASPDDACRLYERVRTLDPNDAAAFENLRRLLGELERWDAMEALLIDVRSRATDDTQANLYDFMLGQLYEHRLARRSDALDHYEAILDRTPDFVAALRAISESLDSDEFGLRASAVLARAHAGADRVDDLIQTLERRLERFGDQLDRSATLLELAGLYEHRKDDSGKAFELISRASQLDWKRPPEVRHELVRLGKLTGRLEEVEIVDREVLAGLLGRAARVELLTEMARTAKDDRNDLAAAEGILREILDEEPGHREVLVALRDLYEQAGRHADVVAILEREVDATPDVLERVLLLHQAAQIQRHRLDALEDAVGTYERILTLQPGERNAYRLMADLHEERARWNDVVSVLVRECAILDDPAETLENRRQIATLLYEKVGDASRALDAIETLLAKSDADPTAMRLLETMLERGDGDDRVMQLVVRIYEKLGAWDHLIGLYRVHVDRVGDVIQKLWALDRMQRIQAERQGDAPAAFRTLQEATRLVPEDTTRWVQLEKMAANMGRQRDLVAFYEGLLTDAGDASDVTYTVQLALRAAGLNESCNGTPDLTMRLYRLAADQDPSNEQATGALRRLYVAHDRPAELVALLSHVSETRPGAERIELLLEVARIEETGLGRPQEAIAALMRVLEVDPRHADALVRIEALHERRHEWDALERHYRRWLDAVSTTDARVRLHHKLAVLLIERRDDPAAAVGEAERVLEDRVDHGPTLALLDKVLATWAEQSTPEAVTLAARVAHLLEVVYPDDAPWQKWVLVYRSLLRAVPEDDTAQQIAFRRKLASQYLDRARDPGAAFRETSSAFLLDVAAPELMADLERIATVHGLTSDLVRVYDAALDQADLPEELETRFVHRAANLYRELSPTRAAGYFERLLALVPAHLDALEALARHYEQVAAWTDLARILALRLDASTQVTERKALLERLADLREVHLRDEDGAVEALRGVLALVPEDRAAKDRLEGLYVARHEWDELVLVLRQKLAFAADDDDRIELLGKIAQVQERQLSRIEDAVATYREVLALSPMNVYAITSLERLYPAVDEWEGLLEVLAKKRTLFAAPRDRVEVDFAMATLLYDRLHDAERALDQVRLVLAVVAEHEASVALLERLLKEAAVRIPVCHVLEPIYAHRGDWRKLAGLIEAQLVETQDVLEKVELERRLAELLDRHLDDPDGAIEALGRAFMLDPLDSQTRDALREVAERSERWASLAGVWREALDTLQDGDVQREVAAWLAEVCEVRLGDYDEAVQRWRQVLDLDEFGTTALEALGRLYERLGRYQDLVGILRREQELGTGAGFENKKRLARVLKAEVGDAESALSLYKELLWERPDDAEVLDALRELAHIAPLLREAAIAVLKPIHRTAERWQDLVELLLLGLEGESDRETRAAILKEVADLYRDKLLDPARAFDYAREAVLAAPEQGDYLALTESLAILLARYSDLHEVYDQLLKGTRVADVRRELLLRDAPLLAEHLGRVDLAEVRYSEVLEVDAENLPALDALEAIYEAQGKVRDLIRVCEIKAELPISVDDRVALYRKIARSALHRQDSVKAEESLTQLLELDGSDADAMKALELIYRQREDYLRVTETMERRARVTEDGAELAVLKRQIGQLRSQFLDDHRGAADAYEEALELSPDDPEALLALEGLYERLLSWPELVRILERRAAAAETGSAEERDALVRLAGIEERHLGKVDQAIAHYEHVLASDPTNEDSVNELLRIYHKYERWSALCEAYERKLTLTDNPGEALVLKLKAAEVYEEKVGDHARAAALVGEVLERAPDNNQALRINARVLVQLGRHEDAMAAYEVLLPQVRAPRERVLTLLGVARLYLETDHSTKALAALREALQLEPDHPEATRRLKEVLYRRESYEALIPILEREFAAATDRSAQAESAYEIAVIYREKLNGPDESVRWLKVGYDKKREHRGIVELLVEHHLDRGEVDAAAPLLGWLVSYLEAKRLYADLARQAYRLGMIYERLGDPDKALRYHQLAHQYDSQNVANLIALGRLLFDAGNFDKSLQILQGLLLLQHDIQDDALKILTFLYLAKVCLALGDKAKAKRHLTRLLAIDKGHAEGNALLAKC